MIRILIVCLVLGGCSYLNDFRKDYIYMTDAEAEEAKIARFERHRKKCTELGFNPEAVEHTQCVLGLEQSWIAARAAHRAANSINAYHASQPAERHCTPNFSTGGCL